MHELGAGAKTPLEVSLELAPKWGGFLGVDGKAIYVRDTKHCLLIGVDHPTQDLVHARVLAAQGGLIVGDPAGVRDRFMIDGKDAGGRFALVQHLFAPRALAAPMHRHHKEDEYTYVLEGRIGAILGDEEVVVGCVI